MVFAFLFFLGPRDYGWKPGCQNVEPDSRHIKIDVDAKWNLM